MPEFLVTVLDSTTRRYAIEAKTAEEAQQVAESSDLDPSLAHLVDRRWEVQEITQVDPAAQLQAAKEARCPACGSTSVNGGLLHAEDAQAWANVDCDTCGATWTEVYTMTAIEELER